jgi:hypothetical protein
MEKRQFIIINGTDPLMIREGASFPTYAANTLMPLEDCSKFLRAMANNSTYMIKDKMTDGNGNERLIRRYRVEIVERIVPRTTLAPVKDQVVPIVTDGGVVLDNSADIIDEKRELVGGGIAGVADLVHKGMEEAVAGKRKAAKLFDNKSK